MSEDKALSVSQFNNLLKETITKTYNKGISIIGEASNIKINNNNLYMTLKDSESSLSCVSWNCSTKINNGDKIVCYGKITLFNKSGTYNLNVSKIIHVGIGNLQKKYDEIKKKYEDLGYYKQENKKDLPKHINSIGIITSLEGAAIQDILYVLKQNNFTGTIYIKNVQVQGGLCPETVSEAIKYFNNKKEKVDILLITRGGGSFEDLMGYSDPKVIEEIYKSKIYTISAVGHETDTMLSDYVADYRAPTPSIASEFISKRQKEVLNELDDIIYYFKSISPLQIINNISKTKQRIQILENSIPNINDKINTEILELNSFSDFMRNYIKDNLVKTRMKIMEQNELLSTYDITNKLQSGYSILLNKDNDIIEGKEMLDDNMVLLLKDCKIKITGYEII
jgi:exodeoxyribonuclease VII large subunit